MPAWRGPRALHHRRPAPSACRPDRPRIFPLSVTNVGADPPARMTPIPRRAPRRKRPVHTTRSRAPPAGCRAETPAGRRGRRAPSAYCGHRSLLPWACASTIRLYTTYATYVTYTYFSADLRTLRSRSTSVGHFTHRSAAITEARSLLTAERNTSGTPVSTPGPRGASAPATVTADGGDGERGPAI